MSEFIRNVRTGARLLARRPAFSLALLLTLGIGIGATTGVFGVIRAVLLRPLPFDEPSRLVMIWSTHSERGMTQIAVSDEDFAAFRDRSAVFEGVAAVSSTSFEVERDGLTEEVGGALGSDGLLSVLGVQPLLGRGFSSDESGEQAADVVMIGEREWRGRFGSDPGVLGSTVRLDGRPFTIVGVLPADFNVPRVGGMGRVEYWAPLGRIGGRGLGVIARLGDGESADRALADVERIAAARAVEDPANAGIGARLVPLHEQAVGSATPALRLLAGVVLVILLVACANSANLLFGHGTRRERELAVRVALGGGRARIIRQLLHENLVIAALGGVFGVVVSIWVTDALIGLMPGELPRLDESRVDGMVLLFAMATTLASVLAAGLLPAVRASRADPMTGLIVGQHQSPRKARGRAIASAVQVTLAVMLLASALLLSRSMTGLNRVNLGYDPDGIIAIDASLGDLSTNTGRTLFADEVIRALTSQPGVRSAAIVSPLPAAGINMRSPVIVPGRTDTLLATVRAASPEWFATMSVSVLRGRAFGHTDRPGAERVAIISETMESMLFGGPAVGSQIDMAVPGGSRTLTIVGVAEDTRASGPAEPPAAEFYLPYAQYSPLRTATVVMKTDAAVNAPDLRARIASLIPGRPVGELSVLADLLADTTASTRFYMFLLGLFALIALALAAIGVFGVVQQNVVQRNFEIGVRLALGADPSDVSRSILRQGFALAAAGARPASPAPSARPACSRDSSSASDPATRRHSCSPPPSPSASRSSPHGCLPGKPPPSIRQAP
jgi:putative ABC transport system permease protein